MNGECLSCERITKCKDTTVELVLAEYVCPLYVPVDQATLQARIHTVEKFGERQVAEALVPKQDPEGEQGDV